MLSDILRWLIKLLLKLHPTMSQIDDLNAAQALMGTNIAAASANLDALQASYLALNDRITAIPGDVNLQSNIDLATQQAAQVATLGERVTFVKNELDALLAPPAPPAP
jgi:hypothetical protein